MDLRHHEAHTSAPPARGPSGGGVECSATFMGRRHQRLCVLEDRAATRSFSCQSQAWWAARTTRLATGYNTRARTPCPSHAASSFERTVAALAADHEPPVLTARAPSAERPSSEGTAQSLIAATPVDDAHPSMLELPASGCKRLSGGVRRVRPLELMHPRCTPMARADAIGVGRAAHEIAQVPGIS